MSTRTYLLVSGALFTIVALAHLWRIVLALPVLIGGYDLPMWASWVATFIPAFLAFSAFRLATRHA